MPAAGPGNRIARAPLLLTLKQKDSGKPLVLISGSYGKDGQRGLLMAVAEAGKALIRPQLLQEVIMSMPT